MRWSWKLGEVAGIGIFVHATFVMLVGWVALSHWIVERSVAAALGGALFILALFGCVVLHELGHALTARRYGIRTRDITLLSDRGRGAPRAHARGAPPGAARRPRRPGGERRDRARRSGCCSRPPEASRRSPELDVAKGPFLERLLLVNLFLRGLQPDPRLPDGRGPRAARAPRHAALLRARHGARRLRRPGHGAVFGFVGLFTNPFLVFIALFVWLGASSEAAMAQMRSAFSGLPVSRAMLTEFAVLAPARSPRARGRAHAGRLPERLPRARRRAVPSACCARPICSPASPSAGRRRRSPTSCVPWVEVVDSARDARRRVRPPRRARRAAPSPW